MEDLTHANIACLQTGTATRTKAAPTISACTSIYDSPKHANKKELGVVKSDRAYTSHENSKRETTTKASARRTSSRSDVRGDKL